VAYFLRKWSTVLRRTNAVVVGSDFTFIARRLSVVLQHKTIFPNLIQSLWSYVFFLKYICRQGLRGTSFAAVVHRSLLSVFIKHESDYVMLKNWSGMKYMAPRSTFWEPENLIRTSWRAYVTQMWAFVQGRGERCGVPGSRVRGAPGRQSRYFEWGRKKKLI